MTVISLIKIHRILNWGNDSINYWKDNTTVTMTGWGQIPDTVQNDMNFKEFGVRSKILKRTRLPIANSKCTETEGEFKIDPNLQYCAGGIKGK